MPHERGTKKNYCEQHFFVCCRWEFWKKLNFISGLEIYEAEINGLIMTPFYDLYNCLLAMLPSFWPIYVFLFTKLWAQVTIYLEIWRKWAFRVLCGWIERCTGNRIDGTMCWSTWCILMHPLFGFLCDILSSHLVLISQNHYISTYKQDFCFDFLGFNFMEFLLGSLLGFWLNYIGRKQNTY